MKGTKRFFIFLVVNIFIVSIIAVIAIGGFMSASETTSVMLVLNDGIPMRTKAIISNIDMKDADKYFTQGFLAEDNFDELKNGYSRFVVTQCDYNLSIGQVACMPWDLTVKVEISEYIGCIEGYLPEKNMTNAEKELNTTIYPPVWNSGIWSVTLNRENGMWKIDAMEYVQAATAKPDGHVHGSMIPTASPTPIPIITPTPTPTSSLIMGRVMIESGILNVRSGPGTSYQMVESLANGETLIILERNDGGWHKVKVGSHEGYCLAEYIIIE